MKRRVLLGILFCSGFSAFGSPQTISEHGKKLAKLTKQNKFQKGKAYYIVSFAGEPIPQTFYFKSGDNVEKEIQKIEYSPGFGFWYGVDLDGKSLKLVF